MESRGAKLVRLAKRKLNFDSKDDSLPPITTRKLNFDTEIDHDSTIAVTRNVSLEKTPDKLDSEKDFSGTDSDDDFNPLPPARTSTSSGSSSSNYNPPPFRSEDEDEAQTEAVVVARGTIDATDIAEQITDKLPQPKNVKKRTSNFDDDFKPLPPASSSSSSGSSSSSNNNSSSSSSEDEDEDQIRDVVVAPGTSRDTTDIAEQVTNELSQPKNAKKRTCTSDYDFKALPPASSSSSSGSSSSSNNNSSSSSSEDEDEAQTEETVVVAPGTYRDATDIAEQVTEELSQPKKAKKRACNRSNWKRNVTKMLKNTGQGYISRTGKNVSAKSMGPACSEKCRLGCSRNFTEEERLSMFRNYWELGNLGRQRDYLNASIKPLEVKYRRVKVDGSKSKPRNQNTAYYLTDKSKEKRVCKLFLLNTLGIAERTLRTVIKAKTENNWGIIPEDKRGCHENHFAIPEEVRQSVKDHINSIPKIESHYLRANTSREFIDGGLTVSEMHRNYESSRREYNLPAANYYTYLHIFNTQFNIGFFFPKKDQCDVCVSYKNAPLEMKPNLEAEYKLHLEEKSLSRIEKKRDMDSSVTNDSLIVSTYDLQAVLPCPIGDSSSFFYKTRLNCYNFTVTTGKNEKTTCYFWHEGMGNRGAVEIGSCVYKYLEDMATKRPNSDVIFYSDNCCGQQKNRFIFAMYQYVVSNLNINSITHKFLIRGHTQNEGDTAHSIIEKCIKRERKSGPIYVPEQYISAIRKAKKSGQPFTIHEMNYDGFFDLKILSDQLKLNTSKNVNGEVIKLSEIKMIRFTKDQTTYEYKTSYKTENLLKAMILLEPTRRTRGKQNVQTSAPLVHNIQLQPAYTSKIPISDRKKKDIMELIQKNIVPQYYAEFYKNL